MKPQSRCERPSSPIGVEALLGSPKDGLTPSEIVMMDRYVENELQARQRKLEVQVRDFASFVHVVREWRKSVARSAL